MLLDVMNPWYYEFLYNSNYTTIQYVPNLAKKICTKAAIICLKKQNFKLKEISKNTRKNTQNSRKNPQNSFFCIFRIL